MLMRALKYTMSALVFCLSIPAALCAGGLALYGTGLFGGKVYPFASLTLAVTAVTLALTAYNTWPALRRRG